MKTHKLETANGKKATDKASANKYFVVIAFFAVLLSFSFSCNLLTGPKKTPTDVSLSVEDVACVNVWLKIGFTDISNGSGYQVKRNGTVVLSGSISGADTVVIDTTAEPSKSYTYTAYQLSGGNTTGSSQSLQVTTLDTTSSSFTFQTWEFGGIVPGSLLHDVSIVSDSDIWAVGAINIRDSSGMLNAIHWNGQSWTPIRINVNFRGNVITPILYGTLAFSPDELWLIGDVAVYGNGSSWTTYDIRFLAGRDSLLAEKGWGISSNNIYFVGPGGTLAWKNGPSWQSLTSGTTSRIDDIWGGNDGQTGQEVILAAATNSISTGDKKILRINTNGEVANIPW